MLLSGKTENNGSLSVALVLDREPVLTTPHTSKYCQLKLFFLCSLPSLYSIATAILVAERDIAHTYFHIPLSCVIFISADSESKGDKLPTELAVFAVQNYKKEVVHCLLLTFCFH